VLKTTKSEQKIVRPHTLFLGVSCHFESFDTFKNASIFFEKARAAGPSQGTSRSPAPRRKSVLKTAKSKQKIVRPHTLFLGVSCHFESFDTIENASIFFEKARAAGPSRGPSRSPGPAASPERKSGRNRQSAKVWGDTVLSDVCYGARRLGEARGGRGGGSGRPGKKSG